MDKDQVAVVDTKTMKVVDKWPTAPGGSPVGMSMDVARRRLFKVKHHDEYLLPESGPEAPAGAAHCQIGLLKRGSGRIVLAVYHVQEVRAGVDVRQALLRLLLPAAAAC